MKLSTKVLAALAAVIFVALATAGFLAGRTAGNAYRVYLRGYEEQQLNQLAAEAGAIYAETQSWPAVRSQLNASIQTGSANGGNGWLPGRGRQRMGQASIGPLFIVDARTGESLLGDGDAPTGTGPLATAPITIDGRVIAALAMEPTVMPIMGQAEERLFNNIYRAIALSALFAGVIALLIGRLLVSSILRPLHQLSTGVAQVAEGNLQVRVDVRGDDEIAQLTRNFNSMAESLQEQEALRQHMVSDIAHELRTPLTVIEGNLQAIIDGVYPLSVEELRGVAAEARHMGSLVSDLHELAQAEAGRLPLIRERIDINQVLTQMASLYRPLANKRDLTIRVVALPVTASILVDPNRLHQILTNLIINAMHHSPPGGLLTLSAEARQANVRIAVSNEGPGISAADLPHVYDRFYRGNNPGSEAGEGRAGLGLAIVKALVELHEGAVGVESAPGKTVFWFDLPAG
ncbi:MAG: HAMP domain-containing protein [Caldilineaceae bacterium]|nr:HAMP domain-containing protein [Caldilineaceae bacterium]